MLFRSERHVWVGRDVGILCAEKIGYGSIIGAKSLVKTNIDPTSCYAGIPAKKIRRNVSWGNISDIAQET